MAASDTASRPGGDRGPWLLPIYPTIMIGLFFVIPFVLIVAVSVAHQNPEGYYDPGFEFTHFRRFLKSIFINTALFSVSVAALVASICLILGFPFTYFITRLPRRAQVLWLVYILAQLSLSEVLIAFSWQVLLSKTAGIGNILVWLGILEKSVSFYPSFGAVLLALTYLVLPFSVLILYPALSRLEPEVTEAARTLGASPVRTFFTVVVPIMRPSIVATGITMFVFTLGAVLVPQVLGRPQHWTLSVLITDQAVFQSNMPFAAALAIFLLTLSMALVGVTIWINRRYEVKA
jgi:putative spermidine/putrescine transport system permease protein